MEEGKTRLGEHLGGYWQSLKGKMIVVVMTKERVMEIEKCEWMRNFKRLNQQDETLD